MYSAVSKARRGDSEPLARLLSGTRSKALPKKPEKPRQVLFDEILEDYLTDLRQRAGVVRNKHASEKEFLVALSRANDHAYWNHLRKPVFVAWFGGRTAESITPAEITNRLEGLCSHSKSGKALPATFTHYRSSLNTMFRNAVANRKLASSPMPNVTVKRFDNQRCRFLDQQDWKRGEEEKRVRQQVRQHYPENEPELDMFLNTGMRPREFWRLRWEDVFLDVPAHPYMWLRKRKNQMQGRLPLNPQAVAALDLLREQSDGSGFVVPNRRKGERPNRYRLEWFRRACRLAGVGNLHPYDLRHTVASRMAIGGVPQKVIGEFLGHKTLRMTERYMHLSNRDLDVAATALGDWHTDSKTNSEIQTNPEVPANTRP